MTDSKDKKSETSGVNPVAAAITGAVVGAGVAVVGAVALSDEKNRKKVTDAFNNVKKQASDYMDKMQKTAEDKKVDLEDKVGEGKKKLEAVAKTVKK